MLLLALCALALEPVHMTFDHFGKMRISILAAAC